MGRELEVWRRLREICMGRKPHVSRRRTKLTDRRRWSEGLTLHEVEVWWKAWVWQCTKVKLTYTAMGPTTTGMFSVKAQSWPETIV
jgi:hypothetical protein